MLVETHLRPADLHLDLVGPGLACTHPPHPVEGYRPIWLLVKRVQTVVSRPGLLVHKHQQREPSIKVDVCGLLCFLVITQQPVRAVFCIHKENKPAV